MAYLIDGHNLIGQLPDISLADPNDEAKLVIKLRGFAARTGKRIIVIFDKGLPAGVSALSNGTVNVIFASHGSTADRLMIERIKRSRDPQRWIVVSGDNQVLYAARERKMKAVRSADFVSLLNAPPKQAASSESKKGKAQDQHDDVKKDVYLSDAEIEAWLAEFDKKRK
jgi:predicted RNA-binding protein with PIN domain